MTLFAKKQLDITLTDLEWAIFEKLVDIEIAERKELGIENSNHKIITEKILSKSLSLVAQNLRKRIT